MFVALLSRAEKEVGSRDGMRSTVETSPYYPAWTQDAEAEIPRALAALERRDIVALGALAERNAWRMHATALAADPPLCYLLPGTLQVIHALRSARGQGLKAYFTLDAGPNPVVLTTEDGLADAERVVQEAGAVELVRCHVGGDATVQVLG
jgi:diphosphomevalonate decarboxylase